MLNKNKKGQSVIESLMTYSWMVVLIAAVLVILFILGVLSPFNFVSPSAIISGFTGVKLTAVIANQTYLEFYLTNALGVTVNLNKFIIVYNSTDFSKVNCEYLTLSPGQNSICFIRMNLSNTRDTVSMGMSFSVNTNINASSNGTMSFVPVKIALVLPHAITTFVEEDFPVNSPWWVVYNGVNESSSVSSISFATTFGDYSYTVGNVTVNGCNYTSLPSSGSLETGLTQQLIFTSSCTATFIEKELPLNTKWSVDYAGLNTSTTSNVLVFTNERGGTHPFSVSNSVVGGCTYYPSPSSGNLAVEQYQYIRFLGECTTTFKETGLPPDYTWNVTYNQLNKTNSSPDNIYYFGAPGNFSYFVKTLSNSSYSTLDCTTTYTPSPSSGNTVAGSKVSVSFSALTQCTTTFKESGLPSGYNWSVSYDGASGSASTGSLIYISTSQPGSSIYNYRATASFKGYSCTSSASVEEGSTYTFSSWSCTTTFKEAGLPQGETSIPITITNSQTTATPSPFQQMINVSNSVYGGSAASNFQNVEFFYSNGTRISSWLENYTYSKYAIYWIKIGSIPASSNITIYMDFAPNSSNLFNNIYNGEAPQLSCSTSSTASCSTYGEYDDGANVFNSYVNFNGTTLPSGYSMLLDSASYEVDNGLITTVTGLGNKNYINGYAIFYTNISTNTGLMWEVGSPINQSIGNMYNAEITSEEPSSSDILSLSYSDIPAVPYGYSAAMEIGSFSPCSSDSSDYCTDLYELGGTQTISGEEEIAETEIASTPISSANTLLGVSWVNGKEYINVNYYLASSTNTGISTGSSNYFLFAQGMYSHDVATQEYYWVRAREMPPNGVMPTVTFGSPTVDAWSVSYDGLSGSASVGSPISISQTVSSVGNYTATASVSGLSCTESEHVEQGATYTFSSWSCTTTFYETGLPSGYTWSVDYNSASGSASTGSSIAISQPMTSTGTYTAIASSNISGALCNASASVEDGTTYTFTSWKCYIPITVYNPNSSATNSTFNQEIFLDTTLYSSLLSSNLENVEFTYKGSVLDSWYQTNFLNTQNKMDQTSAIFWLKLPQIAGSGSETIDAVIYYPSVDLFNGNTIGEAPELSSSYAEYDNGANVFFDGYWDYAGTSLPSEFSTVNTGGESGESISVNNGLSINYSNNAKYVYGVNGPSYNPSLLVQANISVSDFNGMNLLMGWPVSDSGSVGSKEYCNVFDGYILNGDGSKGYSLESVNNGCTVLSSVSTTLSNKTSYVYTAYWPETGNEGGSVSAPPYLGTVSSTSTSFSQENTNFFLGLYDNDTGQSGTESIHWTRLLPYTPESLSPSYSNSYGLPSSYSVSYPQDLLATVNYPYTDPSAPSCTGYEIDTSSDRDSIYSVCNWAGGTITLYFAGGDAGDGSFNITTFTRQIVVSGQSDDRCLDTTGGSAKLSLYLPAQTLYIHVGTGAGGGSCGEGGLLIE